MLIAYAHRPGGLERVASEVGRPLPEGVVWIDLLEPTAEEDRFVEQTIGASVPTREEMVEIEPSSRLYVDGVGRYMTASLICNVDALSPNLSAVTFILTPKALVTVRYDTPKFELFASRACKAQSSPSLTSPEGVLLGLFDAVIDRTADILEIVGSEVDQLSATIFRRVGAQAYRKPYTDLLKQIGRKGDLNSKARESLVTLQRVLLYLAAEIDGRAPSKETQKQLKPMQRDVASLMEHANFLNDKITFLLDAMLGMVGLAQNDIVKLFSVMAVVFLPPTLVASIYGMNFENMPELKWAHGYPMALGFMVLSAILPYLFFKWRRWL
ncbi:magnesium transporter CorA family protein [Chenggangzhangella methanolivorans]|uniref:Magnesium transport protein CorA n=1 Tax=Chenggangzhangella methanolivorans TaxID=1437009 RepID=A0A9E6UNC0_9HYPH|nr:magnesium transporter CorA family protein [Chenggangzhangella methanolivorans]QZO00901.1 magnesium transporter CorA family protein [Chenggangzhangella methanolivorans]